MKRLLAFAALLLGLAALASPAHARVYYSTAQAESPRADRSCPGVHDSRHEAEAKSPRTNRERKNRELGTPSGGSTRTVLLPVIMLADRPLE